MASRAWMARAAALVAAGALAAHQFRYAVAYPEHAQAELVRQGHAYLTSLTPVVVALVLIALASLAHRIAAGAWPIPARLSMRRLWAAAAGAVLVVHLGQESVESWLAPGHPPLLATFVGNGAWAAALASVAAGGLIALALRGGRAAAHLRPSLGLRPQPFTFARSLSPTAEPVLVRRGAMSDSGPARAPPHSCV
jgi:hypothetical protein